MNTQKNIEKFNEIYNYTYQNTLKYIVLHCNNFDDINDLLQDTYLEVYNHFCKNKLEKIEDINNYIIGISKNILKKYYRFKYNNKPINYEDYISEENLIDLDIDLDLHIITKENVEYIWKYIKNKDTKIGKIFYLYYCEDMKISNIANEMNLNESTVKNYIYRTIKEIQLYIKKEADLNV